MIFDDWEQLSTPTIRPGTPSDVNDIARLHVRGWRREFRDVLPEDIVKGFKRPESRGIWMRLIAGGDSGPYVLVADHPRDGIVGFIAAGPERSEKPEYDGEVYALYIDRDHQRSGIGRTLLQNVAQIMNENAQKGLLLWSFSESESNEFFRRLGAQELDTRTRTYGETNIEETAFGWPEQGILLIEGYEQEHIAEPEPEQESQDAEDEAESDSEAHDAPAIESEPAVQRDASG